MQYSFRLAQVLKDHNANERGRIKRICAKTKLERHQVSDLLHNRAKYISMEALAKLCKYLVDHHGVDPQDLPGLLFGRDPENFWELLALRAHLEVCLGVRHIDEVERLFVVASDAYLQGELLHGITGASGAADPAPPGDRAARPRQVQEFRLVPAPSRSASPPAGHDPEAIRHEAQAVYTSYVEYSGDGGLVCLGSMKVNPVAELVLAHTFGATPFPSPDDLPAQARDRRCPLMLRYRAHDPHPPSCCGGMRLSRAETGEEAGIYYEKANGRWECCPWDDRHDAALVFYTHRPTLGRLEMVLGGFSGRGTQCLASLLRDSAVKFWPPSYQTPELQVGAFVVKFVFREGGKEPSTWSKDEPDAIEVVALERKVLARRLRKARR